MLTLIVYLALQYPSGKIKSRIESVNKHLLPEKIARIYLQRLNCASNSSNYRKSSEFNITKVTKRGEGFKKIRQKGQIFHICNFKMLASKNRERRKQLHPRCCINSYICNS